MDYLGKKKKLPVDIYNFLSSDAPRWETERVSFLYGLDENAIEIVSSPIALIFVGDNKLRDYPEIIKKTLATSDGIVFGIAYEINKRIFNKFPEYFKDSNALLEEWGRMKSAPVLSEEEAWKKVLELEPWIAELDNEKKEEAQAEQKKVQEKMASIVKMTLQEALKKYEKLGEQHLSGNPIKLKIFEAPVRPSIKNWIADYYEKVDARHHDSIERGNYLFHSENARKLTTGERQKVGTMLRALDENAAVTIDPQRQEIVFGGLEDATEESENGRRTEVVARPNSGMADFTRKENVGATFSSPHQFPFERNETRPASMTRLSQRPSNNVVDLRND
jgi:hypothetical protein